MNRGDPVKSHIFFLIALLWGLQAAHAGESRELTATAASAGYRVLKVDYEHKGNVVNTRLAGPVLGLTYRF